MSSEINTKGFNNIGNTCYLNSGLQMLIQNIDLCNSIYQNKNNSNILGQIALFINEYYNSNQNAITPNYIKQLIDNRNNIFQGTTQNDAGEFLIYLLEIINDELKYNIFEIETNITIKCKLLACLNKSSHIEKNTFLILDINDNTNTLNDCYRIYKERVKLDNDTLYYCTPCNAKRIASKRLEIIKWPNHLIIWLKRFQICGSRYNKNCKEIDIPHEWRHNYILSGIIYHSGNLFGGHYVYIGKNNNKWYLYNDNHVSEINENQLNQFKNNAYILYYKN
jgi:ubiquitin C-terminal hydrolase